MEILHHVQGLLRASAGCACSAIEDHAEEAGILYLEQWRSGKELHRHIQSNLYLQILAAMDLQPQIRFHPAANGQGMELIEALRGGEA